jgi:[ribosomal protein S18]-alanine N-acetyltransferase
MMPERILGAIRIRGMAEADIPAVSWLDEQSFSLPWPKRAFENEFSNPMARCWVVDLYKEQEPTLAAAMVMWMILDEAHIATIACDDRFRRRGIGKVLLAHAMICAHEEGAVQSFLEARRSNEAALALYRSCGFYIAGVRKNYYSDNQEDALLMSLDEIKPQFWQGIIDQYAQGTTEVNR